MYSCSSLTGLVSSNRRLQWPPNSRAMPKFKQIDFAWPMCRYPLGSGGKRVTMCECLPSRRSVATISRMKSNRSGWLGVTMFTMTQLNPNALESLSFRVRPSSTINRVTVTRLAIHARQPYAGGQAFGAAGAYERIDGLAHFAVNPEDAANSSIVDL